MHNVDPRSALTLIWGLRGFVMALYILTAPYACMSIHAFARLARFKCVSQAFIRVGPILDGLVAMQN
jgi:hypothetical protein